MFRERERFERTDVPRNNPQRKVIAVVVIVVVAIGMVVLCTSLWHKANQLNGLNDHTFTEALYEQDYTQEPSGNAERSDDEFSNTLFFIVDDVHAESPTLQAAYILVRDTTNPSAKLVSFPLNTKMLAGESNVTLQTHFDYAGPAACIVPLTTAANIHVSHAVAATDRIFDQLENLKGSTIPVLLSSATDELETIQSDYHTSELLGLANALREIGFENIVRLDAPYNEETFEDGTLVANIDHQKLCRDAGLFIETAPAPEPEPAPEEGQDEEGSEGEYYEEYWY